MGKIIDFFMTGGDWEEYQRIQLYKKVGNSLDSKGLPLDKDTEIRNLEPDNQKMLSENCPKCKKGRIQTSIRKIGLFRPKIIHTKFCDKCDYSERKDIMI